jgi:hypothetical protein
VRVGRRRPCCGLVGATYRRDCCQRPPLRASRSEATVLL